MARHHLSPHALPCPTSATLALMRSVSARIAVMVGVCSLFLSCNSPVEPGQLGCGLGPLTFGRQPNDLCDVRIPQCPRARPADAQTIVGVTTCIFGSDEAPCTPVPSALCPYTRDVGLEFLVLTTPGSSCTSIAHLVIEQTAGSGVRAHWDAQERGLGSDDICRAVGEPFEGSVITIEGSCCEQITEIPFRISGRTFRIAIRTDWQ